MDTEIEQNLSIDVGEKTPEPCVLKEGGCSLEVKATESIVSVEEKTSDGTLNTNNPNEPIIPIVGSPSLDKTTNQFDGSNGPTNGDDALEELYPAVVVPVNGEESLEIGVETLPAVMEDSGSIEKSAELPQSKLDIEIIAEKMESSSTSVENEIDSNKNDCMNNIITNDEDNSLTVEEETNRKEPDSVAEKEINSDPVSEEINKMEVECIVEEETISKLNESVLEQKTNEKENESVIAQELHNKEIDSVNELEIAEKETSPMLENEKNGTGEVQMMNGELSLDSVIEQEAAEKETSPVLKRERSSAGDVVEMVNGELSSDSVGTSVTPKVIDTGEIPQTSVPNVVAKFVDSSVANVASTSNFIPDNDVTSVLKDVKSAMVNGDITPVESSNKDMENQEINNTQGDTEIIEKRNPLELQESKLDEACVVKDCDKIEENKTNVGSDIPEEKSYTENECEEMDIQMEDVKDENECKIEIDNTCSTSCETKDEKENKVENTVCEGNKTESDVRSKLENLSESQDSIVLLSEGSDVEKDKVTNNQCEETLKNNADIVKTENMKNLDQNLDNDNECVQTEKDTCDSDKNIFNLVTVGAKDSIDMNSTESLSPPVLTEEVQQGNIDIDNDSIDEEPMDIDPVIKEDTKETPVKEPESNNDKKSEKIESECESDKSKTMVRSKTCSQSFKLDQVLSKITSKAENDSLKNKTANAPSVPKKAKARKSCGAQAQSLNKPSVPSLGLSSTITSLTFNVKELEKQGVLDMPKTNKRKAFEPMKVKSNDQGTQASIAVPAKTSPIRSPVKSPNKTENPFFKKSKLMKGKRKKGKRSGVYRLPGEKTHKKYKSRKKESEERQLTESDQDQDSVKLKKLNDNTRNKNKSGTIEYDPNSPQRTKNVSEANVASPTQNALDMLTKNSKLSFQSTPSSGVKKAKKSMRHGIDPTSTHRTLDAFLKGGSYYPFNSSLKKNQEAVLGKSQGSEDSQESVGSEMRKRKAPEGSSQTSSLNTSADSSFVSPEEKKRKMERTKSPLPQMITLFPTGSPPPTIRPIISSSVSVSGSPILIGTGPTSTQPTLIQNGTINGLPMFQIFNNQTVNTSQPPQLVAIAQSPGKSLLNPLPRNSIPKGMPMLLTAVPIPRFVTNGASMSQPQQIISSQASIVSSLPNSIMGTQLIPVSVSKSSAQLQHPTVLKSIITPPRSHLLNGQHLLDAKSMSKIGSLPNGLYPVTPPKTPEEHQTSEAISQESVEVSPGGAIPPDKDVIPLCTCKINGASFQKVSTTVTYCQALDSVDGKVMGCCNKVTNSQLVRPAVKIPFLAVCEAHRKRLRLHQCCPGCGHFCTQGKFMQCRKDGSNSLHHFHEQCQVVKDSKNYCPHCGETSSQFEVHLTMQESKPSVVKDSKSSRVQVKGRIGVTDRRSAGTVEEQEEPGVTHVIEKTKKILSTSEIPIGPDRYSLERVLGSLAHERPKKYRHLPKCLFTPAYDNDLERTVYMLEDGHDANEKYEDLEGQGALHAAATVGSLAIVHCLVQAGASPHLQDTSLRTPLMYSAENNHADVVSYLVKAGAVIDAKADDGMTALHYAAKAGHVGIISLLLDTDRLNIDVKDDGGWTPLIWAAEHQEMEAVKFLLKRNAEPNLRDSEENTTLHWAAFSGSVAIAELLLTAGCDLDSLNMHGDRPLHIAARQDHYECVVLFLARGADVEAKNNKGETPLECCLEKNTQVYLALKVNKQLKGFGAKHMGRPERLLHRDLSKGRENIPIPCVNAVDDEGIPSDYLYVTDNIETTCLNINRVIGSLQSCQCKDDCSSIYCACGKNSLRCWYDKYGRLVPEINMLEPPLIFECNRACECWTTCNNRVVQNGVMSRLQVFKTQGRGWGCKTLVDIQQGTFICEYIGEHISDSEADRREDDSYLFDLDNKDGETYCIDARRYGNIARFINHLCEPNLVPVKVFVDSQDLRFPRICLFASRDIKANEELGFDYGQKFWIIKWKQFTCTCGSLKCRYSTETIQKTLEEYGQRHDEDDGVVVIQE